MKFKIFVQPGASQSEIVGDYDGLLKIKIKAPPVDGEANKEVIRFVAELLGVPKNRVKLVSGEKSRRKTLEIPDEIAERLQKLYS